MNDKDSVKLSEYCFDVCSVLETAIRGKKADDLSGPVRTALEDLERCVDQPQPSPLTILNGPRLLCEIERTLRSGVNPPHTKYDKEKVEEHKLEIREILDVFNPRSPPFGEYFGMIGSPTLVVPAVSAAESGTSSASPSPVLHATLTVPRYILLSQLQHSSLPTFDQAHLCPQGTSSTY